MMLLDGLLSCALVAFPPALRAIALFVAGEMVVTGLLFHFLPELSRYEIFFAVTVDPSYRKTEEAKLILRRFRVAIWIYTAIALGVGFAGMATRHLLIPPMGILWQIGSATVAFLRARRQVLPHAVTQAWHRQAALVRRSAGRIYWLLQIGPFAILAARAAYLRVHWQGIPRRFPVHWGLSGKPNGWSTRSFAGVYGPVLIGFAVCLFVALFSYGVVHWTHRIRSTGSEAAAETRFRRAQLGLLLAVSYFMSWIFGGVPFMALCQHPEQAPSIVPFLLGTLAFIAVLYAVLIHRGKGGTNLMNAAGASDILGTESVTGGRTPDQCWKAGMFYVNPDDPALLVEKRFGIGYTLNFGRPGAWLVAAAILAVAVVPLGIALLSVH